MAQITANPPTLSATEQQALAFEYTGLASGSASIPADPPLHQQLGISIGWDHARHSLQPAPEHLYPGSALRQGWLAGSATFGRRTEKLGCVRSETSTRRWLQLRSHAWSRGRSFEDIQLTPHYLQQIDSSLCPITRQALNEHSRHRQQRSIDRVRDDAGYAAGNLVTMSRAANEAKGRLDWQAMQAMLEQLRLRPDERRAGLNLREWQRLASLCSLVTALPHDIAATLPLHLLPPNRLRLFNPIQALQALLTRQLAKPGWSQRLSRIEALLPGQDGGEGLRADFNRVLLALAPRVLAVRRLDSEAEIRWALEDAWSDPLLQKRWTHFALQLTASQAENLVRRAAARQLSTQQVQLHSEQGATEGWALERKGFIGQRH